MAITVTPDQRKPGGVANQLAYAVGMSGGAAALNQYATGGAWNQLTAAGGPTAQGTTYSQYAPGGPVGQFIAAATGPTGVTGP